MHVASVTSRQVDKAGRRREYQSRCMCAAPTGTAGRSSTRPWPTCPRCRGGDRGDRGRRCTGSRLVPAGQAVQITRSLPHGHVAAVWAQATALGLPGPVGPGRAAPGPGPGVDHLPGAAPGLEAGHRWPGGPTPPWVSTWAWPARPPMRCTPRWTGCSPARTPSRPSSPSGIWPPEANPSRMALFDLSSSWMEGRHCPLAARGYSRDGKKNRTQIEYGLLTDPAGRPVAVRVFPGNTADPAAFTDAVEMVRDRFGLDRAGDGRGPRHDHLRADRRAARAGPTWAG